MTVHPSSLTGQTLRAPATQSYPANRTRRRPALSILPALLALSGWMGACSAATPSPAATPSATATTATQGPGGASANANTNAGNHGGAGTGAMETFSHGYFERVPVYRPEGEPRGVALVISGAEGWKPQDAAVAESLRRQGVFAAGIDLPKMLMAMRKDDLECLAPQGDLDNFSRFLQARYQLDGYRLPILVGNGAAGSAVAYGALATAPQGTFSGAASLAFAPGAITWPINLCNSQLPVVRPTSPAAISAANAPPRPQPARGAGASKKRTRPAGRYTYDYQPATGKLAEPWLVYAAPGGETEVAAFAKAVANATLMPAAFAPAQADAQLADAFARLRPHQQATAAPPAAVGDLPLIEAPATAPPQNHDLLAIMISGDGGWAGIDKDLSVAMNRAGIPVVGFDSLRYFWKARTPDSTARDVERVIRYYQSQPAWKRARVLLIGYSQGADVMPFVVNRLPADLRGQLASAILIGMGEKASFEFHVSNWLKSDSSGLPILPEAAKMPPGLALCAYGVDDEDAICPRLNRPGSPVRILALKGGHHFDGNYDKLADILIKTVAASSAASSATPSGTAAAMPGAPATSR